MFKCSQIIRSGSKYDRDPSFIIRSGNKYDLDPIYFVMSRPFFVKSVTDVTIDILNNLIDTNFLSVYRYRHYYRYYLFKPTLRLVFLTSPIVTSVQVENTDHNVG